MVLRHDLLIAIPERILAARAADVGFKRFEVKIGDA
jgi:hypothetical protein